MRTQFRVSSPFILFHVVTEFSPSDLLVVATGVYPHLLATHFGHYLR
jgi:hypothetical protein